jgi:hypothetical protein
LWKIITRTLANDVSAYKDLAKATYSYTGPEDDDEFLDTKSKWFFKVAKLSDSLDELTFTVPQNFDCIRSHSLQPQTPPVS